MAPPWRRRMGTQAKNQLVHVDRIHSALPTIDDISYFHIDRIRSAYLVLLFCASNQNDQTYCNSPNSFNYPWVMISFILQPCWLLMVFWYVHSHYNRKILNWSLQAYRLWIVYRKSWRVTCPLVVLWLGSLICTIITNSYDVIFFHFSDGIILTTFFACNIAINIYATCMC